MHSQQYTSTFLFEKPGINLEVNVKIFNIPFFTRNQQSHWSIFIVAQQHLNGIRIFGKEIRVSKSKHTTVNMPRDEDEVLKVFNLVLCFG